MNELFRDLPAYPITGGTITIVEPGIYTNAGGGSAIFDIPNRNSEQKYSLTHFFCANRSSANVTVRSNDVVSFWIGRSAATEFILRPGKAAYVVCDGNYYYPLFSDEPSVVQRVAPATGASINVLTTSASIVNVVIVPAGALASLIITFPANAFDGQIVNIVSRQNISSITLSGTVFGGASSLTANIAVRYVYISADAGWQAI